MKKMLWFIGAFIVFLPFTRAQHVQPPAGNGPQEGWTSLLEGKTTAGWHNFRKKEAGEAWQISEDGVLHLNLSVKQGRGDLVTNNVYGDFHLVFEWKIAPGGNSGILFLVQDKEPYRATWHTGPEYQLIDDNGYGSPLSAKQKSGSLYDLIACPPGLVKPAGQWNSGAIRLYRDTLAFYVNGQKALETVLWNPAWHEQVQSTKFAREKDFAREKRGHIAIQDHGSELWIRNMLIKQL